MKSSYFKKMSALVLSLAICMSFMPFVSATAYAADGGEWYLISMDYENTYYINLENDEEAVDLDITQYLKIEPDEDSEDPLTYDSFEYQWYSYDGEEYLIGEGPVLSDATAGYYYCMFTNKNAEYDYGYAYFNVYGAEDVYDGYWYLEDEGDYYIDCGKDDKSIILDAESKIIIEYDDETSENRLEKDDFAYQWYKRVYDEYDDYSYELLEENDKTMEVTADYGDYMCEITNTRRADDTRYAYFRVYEYVPSITGIEFKGNGIHEVKEFTHGDFTQDGTYDANDNFTPTSDYYFYYNGWGYAYSGDFNLGDTITLKYDNGTTDVYTYQTNKYSYEEDGYTYSYTEDEFTNKDGRTQNAYFNLYKNGQNYATRLGVGSTLDATVSISSYYDEEDYYYDDEDYNNRTTEVKDFAKIVRNPHAAFIDGAFYELNEYEKGADLRGFYNDKATEFKVPEKVTLGDEKTYTVRRIDWIRRNIKTLTVPACVHTISDGAFGFTEIYDSKTDKWTTEPIQDFKLYAPTGSAAYEYAKEFGISVEDKNPATNGAALAEAKANAEAKAKEAEEAKANAAAKAAEAEAAKNDSGSMAKEVEAAKAEAAAAKAEAEAKAKEAEAAKTELAILKAQLKKIKGFKATAKKKGKAQINWKKTAGVTGYQVYRSTKKTSGFKKVATIKKVSTLKWNDKKLKKGKKYYYKVRTYTTVNGKNYYGQWSGVKMIKGKK